MKNTKGFKYYLKFYGIVVVAYVIYIILNAIQNKELNWTMLVSITYLPVLFIGLVFIFDTLLEPLFNRMGKKENASEEDQYRQFFSLLTNKVNDQCEFSIEDFRRLRESDKFQKALQQAFTIYKNGETPEINYTLLDKKFKKSSREYEAIQVVIQEVKKMSDNNGKDYQK